MKVKTDEKFISKKAKMGRYFSLAGLVVLSIGMYVSFAYPDYFDVSLLCLVIGFSIASIGSYNVSRWVKPPRGDEVLDKALKGRSNKYLLVNYLLPVPHVLLAPFGVFVLHPKKQNGEITYRGGGKWQHKKDVRRRLKLFFGGEQSLGHPNSELAADIGVIQKYLSGNLPDEGINVEGAVVFLDEEANIELLSDDIQVLKPKDLKKFLDEQQKKHEPWPAERWNKVARLLENPVR